MATKRKSTSSKPRAKAKPRASVETMIKRFQNRLAKLKRAEELLKIRKEVEELQRKVKRGV